MQTPVPAPEPPEPPHLLLDVAGEVGGVQLQGLHQVGVPGQQLPDRGEGAVVGVEPVAELAEAGLLRAGTARSAGHGHRVPSHSGLRAAPSSSEAGGAETGQLVAAMG